MSEMSKEARQKARDKAERIVRGDPRTPVDASGYVPDGALDADVQTGERPISRRQFKRGGSAIAGAAEKRHDRAPRKSGGSTPITANSYVNRDVREANEERDGIKHNGGFKRGGHVDEAQDKKLIHSMMHKEGCKCGKCMGGRAMKARGGEADEGYFSGAPKTASDAHMIKALKEHGQDHVYKNGVLHGVMKYGSGHPDEHIPIGNSVKKLRDFLGYKSGGAANTTGGRLPRASGGDAKKLAPYQILERSGIKAPRGDAKKTYEDDSRYTGASPLQTKSAKNILGREGRKSGGKTAKTNVNIIIATGKGQQPMPAGPVGPLPGAPVGMRQGSPPPPPMMPPGAAPGMPTGAPMPRKAGGRIHMTAGAGSGEGRLEKIKEYGDKA